MGDLKVGDVVFDERGTPSNVVHCSPVILSEHSYEVCFSDGSVIIADAEHLWFTVSYKERIAQLRRTPEFRARRRAYRQSKGFASKFGVIGKGALDPPKGNIRTTAQIRDTLIDEKKQTNHAIPVAEALQLPEIMLPLDPYLLGLWLGDGRCNGGGFSSADDELTAAFSNAGFVVKYGSKYDYHISGLATVLRKLKLVDNKCIPLVYLYASEGQRLALLQGLMDSDGTVTHHGHCEITLCNKRLIDGVLELIISLGIKAVIKIGRAKIGEKDYGEKYRIKFVSDKPVFRLARKISRQKRDGFRGTHNRRYITDVKPTESVLMKCIAVDSPSHLYLAGKSLIPTHNTVWLANEAFLQSINTYNNVGYMGRYEGKDFKKTVLPELEKAIPPEIIAVHHHTDQYIKLKPPFNSIIHYGGLKEDSTSESPVKSMTLGWFAIDQVEEVTEVQFNWLASRLRLNVPGVHYHGFMTANPEPGWVRENFINHPKPYHCFIPALPADNPHLPDDYVSILTDLYHPDIVRRLLEGDWDVDVSVNHLFNYDKIKDAIERSVDPVGVRIAGLDVAYKGKDRSVFCLRQGGKVLHIEDWSHQDTVYSAAKTARLIQEYNPHVVNIDAVGIGAGVYDPLVNEGFNVRAVNVGEKALKNDIYANKRSEYFNQLMTYFRDDLIDIPDHPRLVKDLSSVQYDFDPKHRLLMKSKEAMRRKGLDSPDFADALMLAYCDGIRNEKNESNYAAVTHYG